MKRDLLKYILGLLLFGSNGVVASFIRLQSHEIVLLRSLLGGVFLLGLFFLTGGRFTIRQHKRDTVYVILSGAAMAADWLLLFEAYARIGVSLGMIINYCGPIVVIISSAFFFSEKIFSMFRRFFSSTSIPRVESRERQTFEKRLMMTILFNFISSMCRVRWSRVESSENGRVLLTVG